MFLLRRNQEVDLHKQKLKTVAEWILSKDADPFLKCFSFGCFFHIFTVAIQLPSFSISRLASVNEFLNVNIFSTCKDKCEEDK